MCASDIDIRSLRRVLSLTNNRSRKVNIAYQSDHRFLGLIDGARSAAPKHPVCNDVSACFSLQVRYHDSYRILPTRPSVVISSGFSGRQRRASLDHRHQQRIYQADLVRIFLLGLPARGVHVMSMRLLPTLYGSELLRVIRGAALMGVPCEIHNGRGGRL
ncbi:hypothetical protein PAXRUDRAFT_239194 [Paxillus rubicundulus Ve08.2h10]|uniref:Uncharacterized protein n=1 Tax=Paxillus rubicundulus Ve08.2h10 TaxID=930991 RepID=A0A0D0E6U9_9AGAM|nr:hypothetical protein PAXRUDRAFT_239194 [Paxillus rubicundulus Ve08.2h10]